MMKQWRTYTRFNPALSAFRLISRICDEGGQKTVRDLGLMGYGFGSPPPALMLISSTCVSQRKAKLEEL